MEESLSLYQLNNLIRHEIKSILPDTYWVKAELSDVHYHATGHCYLELIQKDEKSNRLLAKARGLIWSNTFSVLKPYFEEATGQSFKSGLSVLVKVSVDFHELYGYSLTILDVDPTYTIGDLAKRRREILQQLDEEGVLNLNKELQFPKLPQKIAVISSASAAGYGDFLNQLENNSKGFSFKCELFPAMMQGAKVEDSILNALGQICDREEEFDLVVIIRGGGASSDLSDFDTYLLAASCAQFPLPILVGIGHERDETVLDFVANVKVKTPTAAAEYLIGCMDQQLDFLIQTASRLSSFVYNKVDQDRYYLNQLLTSFPLKVKNRLSQEKSFFGNLRTNMLHSCKRKLDNQRFQLKLWEQKIKDSNPEQLLKKGYTLTTINNRIITNVNQLTANDKIITHFSDGEVISVVDQIIDKNNKNGKETN